MLDKADLERLLDYTVWANHRIVRACVPLPTEDFKRDLGASHGGVRGTLTHVMGAEWIWLERWKGMSPAQGIDEGEFPDVMALRSRWNVVEDHRTAWFEALRADGVQQIVRYRTLDKRPFEAPLADLVQHVVNHSTYHRGQVLAFLRQLGAKGVSTDLVLWDREPKSQSPEP